MATYEDQNIFAKILRGEIPCYKVYENRHTLAFLDIMPRSPGHTLVVKFSTEEITKAEIAEALERSARRKNTRIPVAFQNILWKMLSLASD